MQTVKMVSAYLDSEDRDSVDDVRVDNKHEDEADKHEGSDAEDEGKRESGDEKLEGRGLARDNYNTIYVDAEDLRALTADARGDDDDAGTDAVTSGSGVSTTTTAPIVANTTTTVTTSTPATTTSTIPATSISTTSPSSPLLARITSRVRGRVRHDDSVTEDAAAAADNECVCCVFVFVSACCAC
jgi:hypothetical protein